MGENNMVLLEGYEFECTNIVCREGTTAVTVRVSGDGTGARDLSGWILEIRPDDTQGADPAEMEKEEINIVSSEKRRDKGAWMPAVAQKPTYELMGDIGLSGVLFEERVGKTKDDPEIEFRVTFDKEMNPEAARVAFILDQTVFKSIEKIQIKPPAHTLSTRLWSTPIEKTFCLFLVIPAGYKPQGECKTNISITKRGVFMHHETKDDMDDADFTGTEKAAVTTKTNIKGCVKIIACVPLKSHQACGDDAYANACDCFEVDDTIGYTNETNRFEIRDIFICPKKRSLDLTLLNSHCGKSVYRLDGKYIIDCKRCK